MITPDGAKVLRAMIVSCGSAGCFEAVKNLEAVTETVPLSSVGMDASGHWLMAAFSRLKDFAVDEGVVELDTFDVARYFGGAMHIRIMDAISDHAGMGQYLGPYVGLVSHVLMPLTGGIYQNGALVVDLGGKYLTFNPNEKGVPCYHLGVVVNIPLSKEEVAIILADQAKSKAFTSAIAKLKGPIIPPDDYFQALTCTVNKSKV
jgi:uncharacterized protein (DUF3820 family)